MFLSIVSTLASAALANSEVKLIFMPTGTGKMTYQVPCMLFSGVGVAGPFSSRKTSRIG